MMGLGARARGTQENQATKSERKDEEISICIIIYLAFEQQFFFLFKKLAQVTA